MMRKYPFKGRGRSLRHVFMLLLLGFFMGPPAANGGNDLGSPGGPLSEEWSQRTFGKAFGGKSADEALGMGMTSDGGLILAGRTLSFDAGQGYGDAWILKLGKGGDLEWERNYGDELWDQIRAIEQTPDGGYIAVGDRYPPGGSQQAWVIKLKADGSVNWQNTYGRADYFDNAVSARQTTDGGFILLGGTQSHSIGGEQGAWVLKLTGSGEIEWQKFLGGEEFDYLFSVEQTADGGYILAGGTFSYADVPGFSEVWLVKLFADGAIAWEKTFGGIYNDVGYSVIQSADGGYVVAGWTSFSYGDIWVLKTDPSGHLEWQKRYGGKGADVPVSLKPASDGGFLIAGYTSSFGAGNEDGWAFKLTSDGRIEWQKTFGGIGRDTFHAISETQEGYAVTGYTGSFGAGSKDVWIIHFTPFGPGTLLFKDISAPSHAVSPKIEVAEDDIFGFIRDTEVSPTVSVTTTSDTASIETELSEFPGEGKGKPFTIESAVNRAAKWGPWPVVPENKK